VTQLTPSSSGPNFKEPKPEKPERTAAQKQGSRNRRSGMRVQREARKAIEKLTGTKAAQFAGQLGNEEAWHGLPWRVEVKSGKQTQAAVTSFLNAKRQSDVNHAVGDPRPFVHIIKLQRCPAVAVIALDDLPAVLACVEAQI